MPKVSVIIPVFNCEAYVEECLRSVMGQSESDLEMIVVDDGSSDDGVTIAKRLAREDKRICIYFRPHSGRPGVSRNVGLSHATGRYIAFLDGDDLYHPDKLKISLSAFDTSEDIDIIFHDFRPFRKQPDGGPSFLQNTLFTTRAADHLQSVGNNTYIARNDLYVFASLEFVPLHISSTVFRRELLEPQSAWFREDMRNGDDGDFWLRLVRNRKIVFVDRILSYYRQRAASISSDLVEHLSGSIQLHSENLERGLNVFSPKEASLYRLKIATLLLDLGYQYFCAFRGRQARSAYRRSMGLDFRAATLVAYLKTFAPESIVRIYRRAATIIPDPWRWVRRPAGT
jgi:glycosyltransferase involved in cell wall biosynthesis